MARTRCAMPGCWSGSLPPIQRTGERLPIISRIFSCETGWLESGCKISAASTNWMGRAPRARRSFAASPAMVRSAGSPRGKSIMRSKTRGAAGIRWAGISAPHTHPLRTIGWHSAPAHRPERNCGRNGISGKTRPGTRAGEIRLAPRAIFFLLVHEVGNRFVDGRLVHIRAREQPNQTPSRLRGRARSLPFCGRHLIASQRLAEAAVGLLHRAKPEHGALAVIARGQRNGFQGAQYPAGSINVVDAPPAEPGAVYGCIFQQTSHGTLNCGMFRGPAKPAEALDDARGDIGCGRIDHRVVVCKRNVAEELFVVIAVKRAPAAVAVLHAEQPLDSTAYGAFPALGVGILHALERHQHKRGVVDVGIKITAKLEGPRS